MTMRNLLIITASSTSSPSIITLHCQTLFKPNASLSKPSSSLPSSISRHPLLLSSFVLNQSNSNRGNNLSNCADIASKLVGEERFQDFGMIMESVLSCGVIRPFDIGQLLDLKLLLRGIVKVLREGRVMSVVELLGSIEKLGIDVLGLFDGSAMELLLESVTGL
ncbi:hypothetical protein Nepgr_030864 [Nepenthes gracilis]|uniref:Uncharacterized protein n=1 Tax=Nepenthes gracilis TaxID=150966 RepID=A0AAD3TH19_NEPGR|nr:hypothetical protein Nepgr_030864 [Nepenthes gracilis]